MERIARDLGGAMKTAAGWTCRCPAHDDSRPSLDLSLSESGRLLWICRAGCPQDAVQAELRKRGLLPDRQHPAPKGKGKVRSAASSTYLYQDEGGEVVYRAERRNRPNGGKTIWQEARDPLTGKWRKGPGAMDGVPLFPYGLPELIASAPGAEVYIVEGEAKVDLLRSRNILATCNVKGAGNWKEEHNKYLEGKRVVILPDNDKSGRDHAAKVAASVRPLAASVRVVELPNLPPKGDIVDWLDAGHTIDELRALAEAAPEWTPAAEEPAPAADWRATLITTKGGDARPIEFNVLAALLRHPDLAGRVRFNELAGAAECPSLPWRPCAGWRAWTDADDVELAVWCQREGITVKPATCAAAVQVAASRNPHHPVRRYLDGLAWDGVPRLAGWLSRYLGAAVEPGLDAEARGKRERYLREVGRKWLISAVARAYEPGCKADHVLTLEGVQGAGKSSALAALMHDAAWFADDLADLGTKDSAQDLRGKWLIELGELSALRRGEVERIKSFLSKRIDHYRPSYGHRSQDFPRHCVFAGTTNADSYLKDETGNRRFWPAKVGRIDLDALRRDRDQLWAEAVVAFKAGEQWHLDGETEKLAVIEQGERRQDDVWEPPLLEWAIRRVKPFTVGEALTDALRMPVERQDRGHEMRVAAILKANGYMKKKQYPPAPAKPFNAYVLDPDAPPGGGGTSQPPGADRTPAPEVGMEGGEVGGAPEVGMEGPGTPEVGMVGMQKTQADQGPSQPSQPSQPIPETLHTAQERSLKAPESSVRRSLGNRLGGWDGCDGRSAAPPVARPDPCPAPASTEPGFPSWRDVPAWESMLAAAHDAGMIRSTLCQWAKRAGGTSPGVDEIAIPRAVARDPAFAPLLLVARRQRGFQVVEVAS